MNKNDRIHKMAGRVVMALPLGAIVTGGLLNPHFQPWLVVATLFWFQVYFLFEAFGK